MQQMDKSEYKYIDRQKVIDFITAGLNNKNKDENFGYDGVRILTEIVYMDGEDVKPVTYAYWKNRADKNDFLWCNCSNCNFMIENYKAISEFGKTDSEYIKVRYKFCPECGATMFATKELMDSAKM